MSHYRHNLRDIRFTLFDVLERDRVLGTGPYRDVDADVARDMLAGLARLAEEELAASFVDADRNPPVFDPATHTVTTPGSFRDSYAAYVDSEFWRVDVPEEFGGTPVPPSLRWAMAELVLGANPAVHLYSAGFWFSKILHELGTPAQRELARHMVERHWGATMVLTEPDAGSDVGAGRTRAVDRGDGTWAITGVKRFITSAVSDMYENVVHLVLARPEGAGPGTKGLSLFAVPERHVDPATGEPGERNGVFVTNVEHKMGLKVSTTCELRFGEVDRIPAVGTLVGDVHDGIAQMFRIIEQARMMVGTKAIATLSSGYLAALDYARQRVQGPDLTRSGDPTAPRVTIVNHPDVRRSLMLQKAYAEGLRALVLFTAAQQDAAELARAAGGRDEAAERLNDLLLPVVKGAGSERSWVLLGTETLQTFGGSGFLQDYPVEQYVRDAKIDTLYEGTTAIQGMDLFFRKIVRDRGRALGALASRIGEDLKDGPEELATAREQLGRSLDDVQALVGTMVARLTAADPRTGGDPRGVHLVGLDTSRLLLCVGDVLVGWLLQRQAAVALRRLAEGPSDPADRAYLTGKVATARFFAQQVLPRTAAERRISEGLDGELMELDESAF